MSYRILHIGSSMPDDWGGIERYVVCLARAQAAAGHDVTVTAPAGSPLADRAGVATVPILLRHKYDLRAFARYRKLFKEREFDFVVTHFSPDFIMPVLACPKGQTRIMTRHLVDPIRSGRARLYRKLYDGFLGVSDAVARSLQGVGLPGVGVHGGCEPLVSNGAFAFQSQGFRVGSFGRLVKEKGVDRLVSACATATESWNLEIFGSGPERERLEAQAGPRVTLHGQVSHVADAMSSVDVVAIPSLWDEAFSIAALEALSLGKPILATNRGGLPELFRTHQPGILIEDATPERINEAIAQMQNDEGARIRYGKQAQELYQSTYTPAHMAARLTAAYETFRA